MPMDARFLQQEARIVWLTDVGHMDYVRQSLVGSPRRRGRVALPGFVTVGYAELRPDARAAYVPGNFARRVFWLKPYDRALDPRGTYQTTAPAEAVDPRTVAPGQRGEITDRAWGRPRRKARA